MNPNQMTLEQPVDADNITWPMSPPPAQTDLRRPSIARSQPSVMLLSTGLNIGGAERVVLNLAGAFLAAGVRTTVVSLADHRRILPMIDVDGLDIRFLGMRKTPLGLASAAREVARLVRTEAIDIVHAHMPHAAFVAATARLLQGMRVPIVHTSHSWRFPPSLSLPLRLSRSLRDVDVLFAPEQHRRLNASRTAVIPNGIPLAVPPVKRTSHGRPVLIAVGRLSAEKNLGALIQAFASVHHAGHARGALLRIVGDGPMRQQLTDQIRVLGVADVVSLLGMRKDVAELLADADLFALSSHVEGLPLAALEAGAAGLPVIAPPVGALPWLLADDCGYLARPDQLAATLTEVLANRPEASRRAARLQARVLEQFSLERSASEHLALYRRLLAST